LLACHGAFFRELLVVRARVRRAVMPKLRPFTINAPVEAHARIGDAAVFVSLTGPWQHTENTFG